MKNYDVLNSCLVLIWNSSLVHIYDPTHRNGIQELKSRERTLNLQTIEPVSSGIHKSHPLFEAHNYFTSYMVELQWSRLHTKASGAVSWSSSLVNYFKSFCLKPWPMEFNHVRCVVVIYYPLRKCLPNYFMASSFDSVLNRCLNTK